MALGSKCVGHQRSRKHSCGHVHKIEPCVAAPHAGRGFTCRRLALCWGRRRIPTAGRGCTPPGGAASSAAASRGPSGDTTKPSQKQTEKRRQDMKSVCVRACTHPCLEKLVVDLEEARQLHTNLLHGDCDKAHVPVQTTHFLLQELDQKLCNQTALS